jgi:hypothetical protein
MAGASPLWMEDVMGEAIQIEPTAQSMGNAMAKVIAGVDSLTSEETVNALLCMAALMAHNAKKRGVSRADLYLIFDAACDANEVK